MVEMLMMQYLTTRTFPQAYTRRAPDVLWAKVAVNPRVCERWPMTNASAAMHALQQRSTRIAATHAAATVPALVARAVRPTVPPLLHPERINCLVCQVYMPLAVHGGTVAMFSNSAGCALLGLGLLAYGLIPVAYMLYYYRAIEAACAGEAGDARGPRHAAYVTDIDVNAIKEMDRADKVARRDAPVVMAHYACRKGYWSNDHSLTQKIQFFDDARPAKLGHMVVYTALLFVSYAAFGAFAIPCRCDVSSGWCTTMQPTILLVVYFAKVAMVLATQTIDSQLVRYGETVQALGWLCVVVSSLLWNDTEAVRWAIMVAHAATFMYVNQALLLIISLCILLRTAYILLVDTRRGRREPARRSSQQVQVELCEPNIDEQSLFAYLNERGRAGTTTPVMMQSSDVEATDASGVPVAVSNPLLRTANPHPSDATNEGPSDAVAPNALAQSLAVESVLKRDLGGAPNEDPSDVVALNALAQSLAVESVTERELQMRVEALGTLVGLGELSQDDANSIIDAGDDEAAAAAIKRAAEALMERRRGSAAKERAIQNVIAASAQLAALLRKVRSRLRPIGRKLWDANGGDPAAGSAPPPSCSANGGGPAADSAPPPSCSDGSATRGASLEP